MGFLPFEWARMTPNKKRSGKVLHSFISFIESKLKKLRFTPKQWANKWHDQEKSVKIKRSKKVSPKHSEFSSQVSPSQPIPDSPIIPKKEPFYQPTQNLSHQYGDNLIYLQIRDPYWLYAYWEIQKDHDERILGLLGGDRAHVKSILRVYNVTESEDKPAYFDIELQRMADHWFINVGANRSYFVEIGLLHQDGRFVALARSNRIMTPRDGMSEIVDEQWMGMDFDKLYALSGGFETGKSSMELKQMMRERLEKSVTSGSGGVASSVSSPFGWAGKKERKFWFVLDCELIVYGATEPDAAVTMQGKEVKLRPDGTFTIRYALPDGKIILDAVARSADGVEEREIIPVVERSTTVPAPVFLKGQAVSV